MDKYRNFAELQGSQREGVDFRVTIRILGGAGTAIVAPHGGGIEPGTSELATAIAGNDMHIAIFEGTKASGNAELHITSTNFDEPRCVKVVEQSNAVLALHGERSVGEIVYIGGADAALRSTLTEALAQAGFIVQEHQDANLQGTSPENICNRGKSRKGVQLELTRGLREKFFQSLSSEGRTSRTDKFHSFVVAVRQGVRNGAF